MKRLQLLLLGRGPSCVSSASTPSGDRWSLESPAQSSPSSFSSYRSATGQNKLFPYNATKCIFTIGFFILPNRYFRVYFDDIFCSVLKQSKFAYRSAFLESQPSEYYTIKFSFKFSEFFAAETLKGIL